MKKTPTDGPFYHNASIEGYVQFEEASTDTIIATVNLYLNNDGEFFDFGSTTTDTDGYWHVEPLSAGNYSLNFFSSLYGSKSVEVTVLPDRVTTVDTVVFEYFAPLEERAITVDADLSDWNAPFYVNEHDSNWGPNDFGSLYLARNDSFLFICVTGEFSSSDNTVNFYIDKDFGDGTGVNDFSTIGGGDAGNRLRKTVTTPDNFGADIAICNWALADPYIVSLSNPGAVDTNMLECEIAMTSSCIEIAVPFEQMYGTEVINSRQFIALVALIGGGGDEYFADDSIPQQANVATFQTVIEALLVN